MTKTLEKLAAFEARLGQPFKYISRLAQLTEMRTVLQALLQDEVSLEKIYEQFGASGTIPRCADEVGLTQALVDGFERWMKPEPVISSAANLMDLSTVAESLAQNEKVTVAA